MSETFGRSATSDTRTSRRATAVLLWDKLPAIRNQMKKNSLSLDMKRQKERGCDCPLLKRAHTARVFASKAKPQGAVSSSNERRQSEVRDDRAFPDKNKVHAHYRNVAVLHTKQSFRPRASLQSIISAPSTSAHNKPIMHAPLRDTAAAHVPARDRTPSTRTRCSPRPRRRDQGSARDVS